MDTRKGKNKCLLHFKDKVTALSLSYYITTWSLNSSLLMSPSMLLNTEKQCSVVVKDIDSKTNLLGLNQLISMSASVLQFFYLLG